MERKESGPSRQGWAFLLLALVVAAVLRFWALGEAPPGLYRDEAFNGLDALGVLQGKHALFFSANNGREPAYIYLTAAAVALFGRSALAVRLAAAVAGTATTWLTYRLAGAWFGRRTALFAAWLWAVTLWPVHLSRLGLRPILLPPLLALTFWLGTIAYRRQQRRWWVGAGLAYGLTFYTYLAARFTPVLLLLLFSYLLLSGPRRRRLWPGALWFLAGCLLTLLPWAALAWEDPAVLLGRAAQVSILNEAVNEGHLGRTLLAQIGRGTGLFLWRGDTIGRHNPPGRPVFDLFMLLPFLAGLIWALRHWRRPPVVALLLWQTVMLGPTILAEDAPHFLRASGLLPATVILPALGLSKVGEWPKLAGALRRGLVVFLALGTLIMTIVDYGTYVNRPETYYLFEGAARDLAATIDEEAAGTAIYVDRRFWEGWPSIPFLVNPEQPVTYFVPDSAPAPTAVPLALYVWPHGPLAFLPETVPAPSLLTVQAGPLARGDLESEAYLLYVRYGVSRPPSAQQPVASFGEPLRLLDGHASEVAPGRVQVDLYWQTVGPPAEPLVVFVHVTGAQGLAGQSDAPLARGYWPPAAWDPAVIIHERRFIDLPAAFDPATQTITVGVYDAHTNTRLPVYAANQKVAGNRWRLQWTPAAHEEK